MWSIWVCVFPSWEVQVYLWMFRCRNIVLLTIRFFGVAMFTILTQLSSLSWCKLSFLIVGLNISSVPNLPLNSSNIIFIWYYKNKRKPTLVPLKHCLWFITFLLSCCMQIKKMILDQRPFSALNYILSLTNSTPLTADTILWCTKILFQINDFLFLYHRKMYDLLLLLCLFYSANTPVHTLNLIYILPNPWLLL